MSSPSKRTARSFEIHEDETASATRQVELQRTIAALPLPLTTSRLANKLPHDTKVKAIANTTEHDVLGELMAKLEQENIGNMNNKYGGGVPLEKNDSTSQEDTNPFDTTPPYGSTATSGSDDTVAMDNMKRQLEIATERMALMELELAQSRILSKTNEHPFSASFPAPNKAYGPPATNPVGDSQSFSGTSQYMGGGTHSVGGGSQSFTGSDARRPSPLDLTSQQQTLNPGGSFPSAGLAPPFIFNGKRQVPAHLSVTDRRSILRNIRLTSPSELAASFSRPSSAHAPCSSPTPPATPGYDTFFNNGQPNQANFQQGLSMQAPVGSRVSPTTLTFNNGQFQSVGPQAIGMHGQHGQHGQQGREVEHFLPTVEPLNYRRLLERTMSCNWHYVVDKIVCSNDQQASIFLQQKLKVATPDQKFNIVQAIIDSAYPLMINRFGNFLVQRCFEHGSPEQIVEIAQAIRGNTLNLSMDAFGCHVVQKAFDSVPEEYKSIMVHELLLRIPETVIHRYACHVWQKLFELRWTGSPPQIMKYVNEALRGMWHEVALGETGSLVVQNIFENCVDSDKRPCINEVLSSIDVVAHGQFGNWCIQHICEHGAIPDRNRAVDHVLRYAQQYSQDQFASKVVEKCLKVGGDEFLDRYLDAVCEARPDRPRMPLIDISGDQFGNYLIQFILAHADPQRREVVAANIRKHMVSLRGSKYGSRVAMLCSNPSFSTRPGPPVPYNRTDNRFPVQPAFDMGGRQYITNDRGYMGMGRTGGYYR